MGRKVNGEWQFALLLEGVFTSVHRDRDIEKAIADPLAAVLDRTWGVSDLIQFKIDIVDGGTK